MNRLGATGGLAAAAAAGAGYWRFMSPYSQSLGPFPYRGRTDSKVVALTFDDGPNDPFTSQIADFLGEHEIRATFFQVGRAILSQPLVTRRLAADGHVIGNHGFTHEFSNYLTRRTLAEDVRKAQAALATVGLRPALYRPPWLLRVPALGPVLREHRLRAVSGEFCHPLEVFQPRPALIAGRVLAKVRPGSIVIFHDGYDGRPGDRSSTVAAVKIVVRQLVRDGYRFATVSELLGRPAYL
ncbi:MAG TPA: polysaccharide deacetylase family protein [Streptosporangiaceae bacterium]|nr:polysaccharide deacetylase family protein [Streptosporangiaceae bacterium]